LKKLVGLIFEVNKELAFETDKSVFFLDKVEDESRIAYPLFFSFSCILVI